MATFETPVLISILVHGDLHEAGLECRIGRRVATAYGNRCHPRVSRQDNAEDV